MNYDEMSDFEVNKKLANLLCIKWHCNPLESPNGHWLYANECRNIKGDSVSLPNYCNNWADIGPLIDEQFDHLTGDDEFGVTRWDLCKYTYAGTSATRAAAICIMIKLEGEV